jgi:antitoxin VapB
MRREGTRIIIEPVARPSLLAILEALEPTDEDFGEIEDLPPGPVDF